MNMNMSERKGKLKLQDDDDHLSRLKKNALDQKEPVVVKTIIDTIAAFGREGIEPILEILRQSTDKSVKIHGSEVIRRIKMLNP
jgi:hypothetical protein